MDKTKQEKNKLQQQQNYPKHSWNSIAQDAPRYEMLISAKK